MWWHEAIFSKEIVSKTTKVNLSPISSVIINFSTFFERTLCGYEEIFSSKIARKTHKSQRSSNINCVNYFQYFFEHCGLKCFFHQELRVKPTKVNLHRLFHRECLKQTTDHVFKIYIKCWNKSQKCPPPNISCFFWYCSHVFVVWIFMELNTNFGY